MKVEGIEVKIKHPDYKGHTDEIVRLSIENKFELSLTKEKCCNVEPGIWLLSCKEYKVKCPICGRETAYYKNAYIAIQVWNALLKSYIQLDFGGYY